jgi:protein-tyrosine-phosphatase
MKKKILFVCRGNVGRSQMAATIFNQLTHNKYDVSSAGTKVVSKTGESRHGQLLKDLPAAEHVVTSLKEKGIDISGNARTQLDLQMVKDADMIIVMAEQENIPDYLKQSSKMIYFEVDDPKDTPLEEHRKARDQITEFLVNFIKQNNL